MGNDGAYVAQVAHAKRAKTLYLKSVTPSASATDWAVAIAEAHAKIKAALDASSTLTNVANALRQTGEHMRVFRALTAPPISQDQFLLICPSWTKRTEKEGTLSAAVAPQVASTFHEWRDRSLTPWVEAKREPLPAELDRLLHSIAPQIAMQELATVRRNRLAAEQEAAVLEILNAGGWKKLPSKMLDQRAALPARHYMYKTRFATNTATPQEVDIACGLKKSYVLAMECKVTNDETNSVKRINDVLKKADAWKAHWGSFVETAALLQGVIAAKDVKRLLDAEVHVFWSHDLPSFTEWLDTRA